MRALQVLGIWAIALAPALAVADSPIDPRVLGQVEAIRDFCATVAPGVKYSQDLVAAATSQLSSDELQALRDSDEYKQSFQNTSEQLVQVDPKEASKSCAGDRKAQ